MKINPCAPSHPLFPLGWCTDYGNPERAFFQKFETFGLGQGNWAEILWGIWGISGQTISTILALWVPSPWESVAGSFFYKKLCFLGLKHITPKCSQNKILAVKNLRKSIHTSVFRANKQFALFRMKKLNYIIFDWTNTHPPTYVRIFSFIKKGKFPIFWTTHPYDLTYHKDEPL